MTPRPNRDMGNIIDDERLDLDEMLNFATISPADAESAAEWWDENVQDDGFLGVLDETPIE